MKVVLDACVLFPTVLREILIGVAGQGLFTPLWSDRILEEWARATVKLGPGADLIARGEIAMLRAGWPKSSISAAPGVESRLWLPDPADLHVLAVAISGSADMILTFNARDFPRQTLTEEGLTRQAPDEFLMDLWMTASDKATEAVAKVHAEACRLSGEDLPLRALLKRAGLPRLGKALSAS